MYGRFDLGNLERSSLDILFKFKFFVSFNMVPHGSEKFKKLKLSIKTKCVHNLVQF